MLDAGLVAYKHGLFGFSNENVTRLTTTKKNALVLVWYNRKKRKYTKFSNSERKTPVLATTTTKRPLTKVI